jgi:transmembrane secretion effector
MRYLGLLRRPPVLVLWSSQALSVLGDRFFALAVMWLALQKSGAVAMGLVAIAESVPYIMMGAVGHRILARFTSLSGLALVDAVRALLIAVLPWAWAVGGTPVMLSLVVALGIAGSIADPNLAAIVPDLVAPGEVTGIISLMDLTERIARVAGPGLAGIVLLAAPTDTLFVIDAATFAVSGIALAALTRAVASSAAPSPITSVDAPGEKVSARVALRANPELRTVLAVNGFGFLLNAVPALGMPLLLVHHMHAGAGAYGAVLTASGVGALLGNAVAARRRQTGAFVTRFCLAWAVSGLLLAATGMASSLGWILAFSAGSGVIAPIISVALRARLSLFPKPERLRLMSINFTVIRGCGTVGMAVIPAIIADAPEQGFIVGGCALAVVATMAALLGRRSAPPTIGPTGRVGAPVGAPTVAVAYPSSSR